MNTKQTEMSIEEARIAYRAHRDRACNGDVFAGLPSPAKFDEAVKVRMYGLVNVTPARWVAVAHEVANFFVGQSNWRQMLRDGRRGIMGGNAF